MDRKRGDHTISARKGSPARALGLACLLTALAGPVPPALAGEPEDQGDQPPPPNACAPHLTRTPDATITMVPNDPFYMVTIDAQNTPPTTFYNPGEEATSYEDEKGKIIGGCTRWVVEVNTPWNASSGCAPGTCYDFAEILLGAGEFPSSDPFEDHFYRPEPNVSIPYCLSYKHKITVYRKPAGSTTFTAVRSFLYQGHWDNGMCRVYALNPLIHDTAEVYAPVSAPTSGTDVYRVLHLLEIDGYYQDTVTVVEFEEMEDLDANARSDASRDDERDADAWSGAADSSEPVRR